MARRVSVSFSLNGVDITEDMKPYFLSLTYTDYEEGESDDLQVTFQDRDEVWLTSWLEELVAKSSETVEAESTSDWYIGQEVTVSGRCQYTSYGTGSPGVTLTNHVGKITYLNLKSGIPYPIHVDHYGWFAESQVTGGSSSGSESESEVSATSISATITMEGWNGKSSTLSLPCGSFELDSVEVGGPPSTVTLKGVGLPFTCNIRQTEHTKGWECCSLSQIAREMATENGLGCLYESKSDPYYERVEQYHTSDIAFLLKLCQDGGISLKATNNTLVLFDQLTYEHKDSVLVIRRKGRGYTKYKLYASEADSEYASCRVSYTDPLTGAVCSATAYVSDYDADLETNQQLEISQKVGSVAEALAVAKAQLRRHNKFAKTAVFTLAGNCNVVGGAVVELADFGSWDGSYMVYEAKHSVGSGGYTVQVKLRRVLEGY